MTLDLPEGWGDAPGSFALALMTVLDKRHDPDAGVFAMIIHGGPVARAGSFVFHVDEGATLGSDAGIRVLLLTSASAATAADEVQAALQDGAYTVKRSTVTVPLGRAVVLEWDQAFNGPPLHFRAVFVASGGSVMRIDLGTLGAPKDAVATEFLAIVRSASLEPAPGASP
jgi:hypothetical protein